MFNPNATDLLVMEDGADKFQLIAPSELVSGCRDSFNQLCNVTNILFEKVVNMAIFEECGKFHSTFGIANREADHSRLFTPQQSLEEEEEEKDKKEEESNEQEGEKQQVQFIYQPKGVVFFSLHRPSIGRRTVIFK